MLDQSSLREAMTGAVILPGDNDYDQARTIFPGGIDRRPAAIVRVSDAADVARTVGLARDLGLPLAVRSGGHSIYGVADGAIVIDLSAMRSLDIDVEARTAWAGTGLTAGEYAGAAAAHGLATGFGDTASVGIGGLTLGGGIGFLARKYGLTIDDLLAAEMVTADGSVLHVDAESHPDLFWAIRGGGGNFGVATRYQFRLHEVSSVTGGMLILPATPEVIAGFVAQSHAAPDELSAIANIMLAPPMPFLPEELHGQLVVIGLLMYAGDAEAGERAVGPFRALATPLADMVRPMTYPEIHAPEQKDYHPVSVGRTYFADNIDLTMATLIVDQLRSSPAPMRVVQLRVLGGAMGRVPSDATAFAHRDRSMMVTVAALYEDPAMEPVCRAWVLDLSAALRQGEPAAFVSFLNDDGPERIREAYPGSTWDRLVEVKGRYDPDNLFRLNNNIPPS
jgi:FAD binding domain/Berberine and berberine like